MTPFFFFLAKPRRPLIFNLSVTRVPNDIYLYMLTQIEIDALVEVENKQKGHESLVPAAINGRRHYI